MTMLGRILERMARLSPPRHRELVRGMRAELDSIVDPAERARFALGAVAAIARLALRDAWKRFGDVGEPEGDASEGGPSMPMPTTRQLLVRHVVPFTVSLVLLTFLLEARRWTPLRAGGASNGAIVEMLVLALPSTLALTVPMAVFLAVSWVFARLGDEGTLATARRRRGGVRRLTTPVLGAAAVVATFALVSNTQVLPRANARLVEVLADAPRGPADRTMTIGELSSAAQSVRATDPARAAAYEVEIQKKFAISAACLILALVAAAISLRFPRGGGKVVLAGGNLVFIGYWLLLIAGEELAHSQLLSPVVGMWMANVLFLAVALLLIEGSSRRGTGHGAESLAIDA